MIKRRLHLKTIKNAQKRNIFKSQQKFKSEANNVFTETVNKVPLSFNDDKRVQSFHRVKSCPYGTSAENVWKEEVPLINKIYKN